MGTILLVIVALKTTHNRPRYSKIFLYYKNKLEKGQIMAANNEINKINNYLKQKTHSDNADNLPKPSGVSGDNNSACCNRYAQKHQKSAKRTSSSHEQEKLKMQLWLKNALNHTKDFSTLVVELLEIKGYKNDYPQFYNKADIDRRLFSKIINTKSNYHPDIKTVFKIIIGLELDLEQANELLKSASYSFGSSLFNLIIQYCVENQVYEHKKIDKYLTEYCGETLYSIE